MYTATTTTAAILALAATLATAQDLALLSTLPTCAQKPAESALSNTGCDITNVACICSAAPFLKTLAGEIIQDCSPSDQAATLAFAEKFCGEAGVSINPAAIAGSSAPATTAPASSAVSTSAAASPPVSSAPPTTSAVAPVSQATDGQVQVATSKTAVAPASQITDGQVQVPTAHAASQITDGQVQVPTGGSVVKNGTGVTTGTPVPFVGGAGRNGVVGSIVAVVAAVAGVVLV